MSFTLTSPFDISSSHRVFNATSVLMRDDVDMETGAILDEDNVAFTYGEDNNVPETATLLRERQTTTNELINYEDATAEQRASGNSWWERDTSSQEYQDSYDGMGNYVGEGDAPLVYGEGVGGEGTQTFVSVERNIFQRAWCLVGDCSEVNTNTQRRLDMLDYNEEDEPAYYSNAGISCYDENEEYICDDDGNLITESAGGGGGGGFELGDDEQSETMSNNTATMIQKGVPKWVLPFGLIAIGSSYYYGTNKEKLHRSISNFFN